MKRFVQAALLLACGAGLLRASLLTDAYLRYVKEGMRPLLIGSGVLLVLLGVAEAVAGWRAGVSGADGGGHAGAAEGDVEGRGAAPDGDVDGRGAASGDEVDGRRAAAEGDADVRGAAPGGEVGGRRAAAEGNVEGRRAASETDAYPEGHGHSGVPKVAWLLFLPAVSLLLYAPPALGSYTAAREAPKAVAVVEEDGFDPLPATSPLPVTLTDFTQRVQQDASRAIEGRTVLMTGFVTPADGGGWYLTRILLSCCAADAQSVKVRVYGVAAPPADSWVSVTGTWHADGALGTSSAAVALDGRAVREVPRPVNGYTDALPLGSR